MASKLKLIAQFIAVLSLLILASTDLTLLDKVFT